ncbi:probable cytochrome P450 12a5, mitochondrial [Drosophila miranda]|uniref:probable cytochrome P450 12a5, mitochondrial n=1 Tax=Drosophila miranda TaxID=7229 RepID=UPI00143F121D|nr:probable cytochrome P450 12a5, mitochondrial [Drosophila miranda]
MSQVNQEFVQRYPNASTLEVPDNFIDTINRWTLSGRAIGEGSQRGVVRPENEQSVLEKLLKVDKKVATIMAMDMLMAELIPYTSSTFTGVKNPEKAGHTPKEVMKYCPQGLGFHGRIHEERSLFACQHQRVASDVPAGCYECPSSQSGQRFERIPMSAGTCVSMVPLSLLSSEEHFPKAAEFLPERWIRNATDSTGQCPANDLKLKNPFVSCPSDWTPDVRWKAHRGHGAGGLAGSFELNIEFNHSTEKAFAVN